eukprot:2356990-Pleurochrysis_carterae.AAC.5
MVPGDAQGSELQAAAALPSTSREPQGRKDAHRRDDAGLGKGHAGAVVQGLPVSSLSRQEGSGTGDGISNEVVGNSCCGVLACCAHNTSSPQHEFCWPVLDEDPCLEATQF